MVKKRDETRDIIRQKLRKLYKSNNKLEILNARLLAIQKLIYRNQKKGQIHIKLLDLNKPGSEFELSGSFFKVATAQFSVPNSITPFHHTETVSSTLKKHNKRAVSKGGQLDNGKRTESFVEVNDSKFFENGPSNSSSTPSILDAKKIYVPFYALMLKNKASKLERTFSTGKQPELRILSKTSIFMYEDFELLSKLL